MKHLMIALTVAVGTLLAADGAGAAKDQASVVAEVNGLTITQKELDEQVNILMPRTFYHATASEEKIRELEQEALDKMIDKKLFYLHAKEGGITVSDSEIDTRLEKIKEAFEDEDAFEAVLERGKIKMQKLRDAIREDEMVAKLLKQEVTTHFSEADLKAYYEKNRHKFKEPEKIKLSLIYVRNDPGDPDGRKKAQKKMDEAVEKIESGEPFADVAAEYSDDMYRIKGGDMGYLHKGRLDAKLDEVAFSLPEGEMSEVIEMDTGFFLLKVEDKKEPNQLSFEQIKFKLKQELTETREKEKLEALTSRLKRKAEIKIF